MYILTIIPHVTDLDLKVLYNKTFKIQTFVLHVIMFFCVFIFKFLILKLFLNVSRPTSREKQQHIKRQNSHHTL